LRFVIRIITNIKEMQLFASRCKTEKKAIGLVPTMGYLHQGHISLVKKSKNFAEYTVVSVFVNPTQFGPNEDFNQYPRDIERDKKLLADAGADILFLPDAKDIYPEGFQTYVEVEKISKILEGATRPIHFKGVTTIVSILFNCVKPEYAFFGQKDAQQVAVLKQMVKDLKMDIDIIACPLVREADGLALSSRNTYLEGDQRKDALVLYKSLQLGKELVEKGERKAAVITGKMKELIATVSYSELDYIQIVDTETFQLRDELKEGVEYYILIACRIGKPRLIDNIIVKA